MPFTAPESPDAAGFVAPEPTDASLGIGELRRREGQGEIAAGTPSLRSRVTEGFNLIMQAIDQEGWASGVSRDLPAMAAAAAIPGPAAGGLIYRTAVQGLNSGLAYQAVDQAPQVLFGDKTVANAIVDSAVPVALSTVAGPLIAGAGKAIGAGVTALTEGTGAGVAQLFRPVTLTPEQLLATRSRDMIENATGQRIPLGIAEVLNSKSITRDLAKAGGELLPETLSTIETAAMHVAANTAKSGRTLEDVSKATFDILDAQKTGIGDTASAAVEAFARKSIAAVNKAEGEISGVATSIFKGRSFAQIGTEIRELAVKAYGSSKKVWDDAYDAVKAMPEYQTARVDLTPVRLAAQKAGLGFVRDMNGAASVIGTPQEARAAITGGMELANGASIEQARNLVTEMSKNLNNPAFLPGVDIRVKMEIISAAKNAVEAATAPFPALSAGLKDANKIYADNIDRFKTSLTKGILSDFGPEGGASPEAIIRRLTGQDAESNLQQVLELAGKGATAGGDFSPQILDKVREAVLSRAAYEGTDAAGKISIGKMFSVIDDLPKPVQDQLWGNVQGARNLLLREAALKTASKSTESAKIFLDQVQVSPMAIGNAFKGDVNPLLDAARAAIDTEAVAQKALRDLGLDQLSKQSAFDLKRWISDPSNQGRIANTLKEIGRKNPSLVAETKALFMENIIEESSRGGIFDPKKFLELIQRPTLPTGPGAPGVAQGKYAEAIDSVLGAKTRGELSSLASEMTNILTRSDVSVPAGRSMLHYLFFGFTGGNFASGTPTAVASAVGRVTSASPQIKYRIAAHFLTDDALRAEAMKEISPATLGALDKAVRATAVEIGSVFGKRSPLYQEVQDIDASVQPTATRYQPPLNGTPAAMPTNRFVPTEPAPTQAPVEPPPAARKTMSREEAKRRIDEAKAKSRATRESMTR